MAINNCFYIKNTGDKSITLANQPQIGAGNWGFDYSINNTTDWVVNTITKNIVLNPGDKVYFKGTKTFSYGQSDEGAWVYDWFSLTSLEENSSIEIGGSLWSLLHDGDGDNEEPVPYPDDYRWWYLFRSAFSQERPDLPHPFININVNNLKLTSTMPVSALYNDLFSGQKGLTHLPNNFLTDIAIKRQGCQGMFMNTGIKKVPENFLPSKTASREAYKYMFRGCKDLNEVSVTFTSWTDTSRNLITTGWLDGVAEKGTFRCPKELPLIYDESHIPVGWNAEYTDKVPEHRTITFNKNLKAPFNKWANLKPGG